MVSVRLIHPRCGLVRGPMTPSKAFPINCVQTADAGGRCVFVVSSTPAGQLLPEKEAGSDPGSWATGMHETTFMRAQDRAQSKYRPSRLSSFPEKRGTSEKEAVRARRFVREHLSQMMCVLRNTRGCGAEAKLFDVRPLDTVRQSRGRSNEKGSRKCGADGHEPEQQRLVESGVARCRGQASELRTGGR